MKNLSTVPNRFKTTPNAQQALQELLDFCSYFASHVLHNAGDVLAERQLTATHLAKLLKRVGYSHPATQQPTPVQNAIAIVWSIEDIQNQREDLSEAQARNVLQQLKDNYDAHMGIHWEIIDLRCEDLYPPEEDVEDESDD